MAFDPSRSFIDRRAVLGSAALGAAAPFILVRGAAASEPVIVETQNGRLRGARNGAAMRFLGVSYAADTGGANRFCAPAPVAKWAGVRDAAAFGVRAPQIVNPFNPASAFAWNYRHATYGENCCVLNIYAPSARGAPRPVMFYMHGGGFRNGGGDEPSTEGSALAAGEDVVVVTVNHRLNIFGYLNLGFLGGARFADSANAGMLDLIAALGWVRDNIAAFGGDPGNVTIFGHSGGGNKAMALLGMPAAKGLFRRAIDMAGVVPFETAQSTEPYVLAVLKALEIDRNDVSRLQSVPADALLKAWTAATRAHGADGSRPVLDGRHFPADWLSPQGMPLHANVPVMFGVTTTEAAGFLQQSEWDENITQAQVRSRIMRQFQLDEPAADKVIAGYRAERPARTPADILVAFASDVLARGPMIRLAERKSAAGGAPAYLYDFDWHSPSNGGRWRAPHGIDVPFAFANTAVAAPLAGTGENVERVSAHMRRAFVAFARTGTPGGALNWPPYDAHRRATMVFHADARVVDDFLKGDRLASQPLVGQGVETLLAGPLFRG